MSNQDNDNNDSGQLELLDDLVALHQRVVATRDRALVWLGDLVDEREHRGLVPALTAFERLDDRVASIQARYLDARDRVRHATSDGSSATRIVRFLDPMLDLDLDLDLEA